MTLLVLGLWALNQVQRAIVPGRPVQQVLDRKLTTDDAASALAAHDQSLAVQRTLAARGVSPSSPNLGPLGR
jgi:hypothetical protein